MKTIVPKSTYGTSKVRVQCSCHDPNCYIDVDNNYFDDKETNKREYENELEFNSMEHKLYSWKPFFGRVWCAIKLIFGKLDVCTSCVAMDTTQIDELIKALEQAKDMCGKTYTLPIKS